MERLSNEPISIQCHVKLSDNKRLGKNECSLGTSVENGMKHLYVANKANSKENHTQMTPRSIFRMQRLQMLPEQQGTTVTGFGI